jgi:hypothetical protein
MDDNSDLSPREIGNFEQEWSPPLVKLVQEAQTATSAEDVRAIPRKEQVMAQVPAARRSRCQSDRCGTGCDTAGIVTAALE